MPEFLQLSMNHREAEYLKDVLDWWIEATEDATPQVDADRTVKSLEELLELADGIRVQYRDAVGIRERLQGVIDGRGAGDLSTSP